MQFHVCTLLSLLTLSSGSYTPTWPSLDSRPLPSWYDWSKFGVFCHWGVYSVPSFQSEWFWWDWKGKPMKSVVEFMQHNYKPGFSYADFGPQFTAELFDAHAFADIIKHSGAKYFVLTSKHHEGYTMWPSKTSWNWNAVDVGPHRDLVGEMRQAFKELGGVHFGLYFSQFEWFNPLFNQDRAAKYKTTTYVDEVSYPQMLEIVKAYEPEVIWSDGAWDAEDTYWKSKDFLAWLYNQSPVKDRVVVNDRWGRNTMGKHGGYMTYTDHFDPGHILKRKWENCLTMDKKSWGFRRTMTMADVHSVKELITQLARTISCNGNMLLNVGPTHDGRIVPMFQERLRFLGHWLQTNGEAVYGTKPWVHVNDSNVWYTSVVRHDEHLNPDRVFNPQDKYNTIVYAFVLDWPHYGHLILPSVKVNAKTRAEMLGHNHHVPVAKYEGGAKVDMSGIDWHSLPSFDAWVIRLQYLDSEDVNPIKTAQDKGLLTPDGLPNYVPKNEHKRHNSHDEFIKAENTESEESIEIDNDEGQVFMDLFDKK